MPNASSRSSRRGQEEKGSRVGKMAEKSKSFHGQMTAAPAQLRRPKTQPDLYSSLNMAGVSPLPVEAPRLTKLLLNVTVLRSLGPVQVLMQREATVGDLVKEAVRAYGREGRRPLLPTADPAAFDLHYSQFSLESLDPKEKLVGLGSRNFFLCPKPLACDVGSCSKEAEKASKTWLRFMDFLR